MKYKYLLVLLIAITCLSAFRLSIKNILSFKTSTGHVIKVSKGQIFYDNRVILKIKYGDDILYESKFNRLIEDHGVVFLFIALDDRPNIEKLNTFLISSTKATPVVNAILSSIKDYDNDGYLEFGGRDLTEGYNNLDSMYYVPTTYYEIREGKIRLDNALMRKEDIKLNGLYLPLNKQMDKNGFCCKVIPNPRRKPTAHIQSKSNLISKSFMSSDTISVFATKYILVTKYDITNVDHFNDGTWLFYSNNKTYTTEAAAQKVKLASIIEIDKSILLLSWMPKGYVATRSSKAAPWTWNRLKDKN